MFFYEIYTHIYETYKIATSSRSIGSRLRVVCFTKRTDPISLQPKNKTKIIISSLRYIINILN
jgi:hypothetical protein